MTRAALQIALRGAGIAAVLAFVVLLGSLAREDGSITFATGGIDLKIDSKAWYNGNVVPAATWAMKNLVPGSDKFFNFSDIKPGDSGCNVISIHVQNTNAWACVDFNNLTQSENGQNEPEGLVDTSSGSTTGELAAGTEFFGWTETDGDGKFEPPSEKPLFGTSTQSASSVFNNKTYAIGDSKNGNSCKPNTTRYVGMCWCAGNLTVNLQTGAKSCDGSVLGNAAQTDSWTVDVAIRTESEKDKPQFMCGVTPPNAPKDDSDHHDGNGGNGNGNNGGNNNNSGGGSGQPTPTPTVPKVPKVAPLSPLSNLLNQLKLKSH